MGFGLVYIADIGEALGAQQLLKYLRGDAGCRVFFEADRGDFRRRLRRERLAPGAKPTEACSAGECGIGQEAAATLHDGHGKPPSFSVRVDRGDSRPRRRVR
jgi:hypothetical protein